MLENEELEKVEGSEREVEAAVGMVISDDAETGVRVNDEVCNSKEDCFGEGTEVDCIGVYHEQRTPILCVLFEMLTTFPRY